MVSRFNPLATPSNDLPTFSDTPDRAMQRTALLAQHLFPISDFSDVDFLQPLPVVGGNTSQPNRNNNAKAPARAPAAPSRSSAAPARSQSSRPQPAPPRPNPPAQRAAPPPQRPAAPPSPPRFVPPLPTPNLQSPLTQRLQRQFAANLPPACQVTPLPPAPRLQPSLIPPAPRPIAAPVAPPQHIAPSVQRSAVPTNPPRIVTPPTPTVNNSPVPSKIHQLNPPNLVASTPNFSPLIPVSQPAIHNPILNSSIQPLQVPTSSVSSAPQQTANPPSVPLSVPPAASNQNFSFATHPMKPPKFPEPKGLQQNPNPSAIPPGPIVTDFQPLDLNQKVVASSAPNTISGSIEALTTVPPSPSQIQAAVAPSMSTRASITPVDTKLEEDYARNLARSKQNSVTSKMPTDSHLKTVPVPSSQIPPTNQKAVEAASQISVTALNRTSNIVNQFKKVPSSPVQTLVAPVKDDSFIDYSVGFFKGLKNGVKESATDFIPGMVNAVKTLGNFTYETIKRPIEHTKEVYAAIEETIAYVKTHDLGEIGQKLAPEVHKLVTEWDTLPSVEKGELTGYCIGKYGTDLALTAGALKGAKIVATAVRTEIAVGAAVKEAVEVSNANKAIIAGESIAGGVEVRVLANEAKAATRVVGALEKSAVEVRTGSAATQALGKEVKLGSQQVQIAEQTERLLSKNEAIVSATQGAALAEVEVIQLEKTISNWLGEGAKFIRNEAGDPVFLSKDGLRCVRFDFNKTKPHNNLHVHVEIKVDGKWVKSGQIYPTDVPHN